MHPKSFYHNNLEKEWKGIQFDFRINAFNCLCNTHQPFNVSVVVPLFSQSQKHAPQNTPYLNPKYMLRFGKGLLDVGTNSKEDVSWRYYNLYTLHYFFSEMDSIYEEKLVQVICLFYYIHNIYFMILHGMLSTRIFFCICNFA